MPWFKILALNIQQNVILYVILFAMSEEKPEWSMPFAPLKIASAPDNIRQDTHIYRGSFVHEDDERNIVPVFRILADAGIERIYASDDVRVPVLNLQRASFDLNPDTPSADVSLVSDLMKHGVALSNRLRSYIEQPPSNFTDYEPIGAQQLPYEGMRFVGLRVKDLELGTDPKNKDVVKRANQLGLKLSPTNSIDLIVALADELRKQELARLIIIHNILYNDTVEVFHSPSGIMADHYVAADNKSIDSQPGDYFVFFSPTSQNEAEDLARKQSKRFPRSIADNFESR